MRALRPYVRGYVTQERSCTLSRWSPATAPNVSRAAGDANGGGRKKQMCISGHSVVRYRMFERQRPTSAATDAGRHVCMYIGM
jgi:hypothetical protein